jgi:hypothetical protein
MPNWCCCELEVTANQYLIGDIKNAGITGQSEIDRFIKAVCKKENADGEKIISLDFDKVIPYPKKFKMKDDRRREYLREHPEGWVHAPKDGFNHGGHAWCIDNWGTKWNSSAEKSNRISAIDLILYFDTPWSPPTPVIEKIIVMFPSLVFDFQYWEGGMGFQGRMSGSSGKLFEEWSGEYNGNKGG